MKGIKRCLSRRACAFCGPLPHHHCPLTTIRNWGSAGGTYRIYTHKGWWPKRIIHLYIVYIKRMSFIFYNFFPHLFFYLFPFLFYYIFCVYILLFHVYILCSIPKHSFICSLSTLNVYAVCIARRPIVCRIYRVPIFWCLIHYTHT